jgi:type II secretory pathway component GspD/PulD (secretin)
MRALQVMFAMALLWATFAQAAQTQLVSLSLRDVDIAEALAMLAKQQRLNILLSDDVEGSLSLSLYDVPVSDAVHAIANAAGYAVERRSGAYFVLEHEKVGMYTNGNLTQVRSFDIHYANPETLEEMLEPYLSRYGKIKAIPERNLILVSDKPEFLTRIATLVKYADKKPRQVIIEAQILEVSLNDEDSYGIDWSKLFESQDGGGSFGLQGLAGAGSSGSTGFFFDFVNPNIDLMLTALQQQGRVRTLSTPKLVALDNQEAEVIIGDRRGYQVTTTINQVTSESIEFLESGVILRVTPHIDNSGQVLMEIHPEVSTGTVDAAGIPSQTTTEVTTSLLVPGGETVFIGGLMKHSTSQIYKRAPLLGRLPVLKRLFSSREETQTNTETIVLISPRVVQDTNEEWNREPVQKIKELREQLAAEVEALEASIETDAHRIGISDFKFDLSKGDNRSVPAAKPLGSDDVSEAEDLEVASPPPIINEIKAPLPVASDKSKYTVQLMSMTNKRKLYAYLLEHGLTDLTLLTISEDGQHALLLGTYGSFAKAKSASVNLPAQLAGYTPWIRELSSTQLASVQQAPQEELLVSQK